MVNQKDVFLQGVHAALSDVESIVSETDAKKVTKRWLLNEIRAMKERVK